MSNLQRLLIGLFLAAAAVAAGALTKEKVVVRYDEGALTLHCSELPLEKLLEAIQEATGIEFLIEDSVRSLSINANLDGRSLRASLEDMLEGTGANYVMVFAPEDNQKVTKVYVGAGDPASILSKAQALSRSAPDEPRSPTPDTGDETYSDSPALTPDEPIETPPVEDAPSETPDLTDDPGMKPPLDDDPEHTPAVGDPAETSPLEGTSPAVEDPSISTTTTVEPPRKPKKK